MGMGKFILQSERRQKRKGTLIANRTSGANTAASLVSRQCQSWHTMSLVMLGHVRRIPLFPLPFSTLFVDTDCTTILTTCHYLNCTLIFFSNNAMSVFVTLPISHSSGRHCSRVYFHTQLGLPSVLVVTSIWYDDYSKPRFFPSKKLGALKVSVPLSEDLPYGSIWSGRGLGTRHGIRLGLPLASCDTLLTAFCLTIILLNIIFWWFTTLFWKTIFFRKAYRRWFSVWVGEHLKWL